MEEAAQAPQRNAFAVLLAGARSDPGKTKRSRGKRKSSAAADDDVEKPARKRAVLSPEDQHVVGTVLARLERTDALAADPSSGDEFQQQAPPPPPLRVQPKQQAQDVDAMLDALDNDIMAGDVMEQEPVPCDADPATDLLLELDDDVLGSDEAQPVLLQPASPSPRPADQGVIVVDDSPAVDRSASGASSSSSPSSARRRSSRIAEVSSRRRSRDVIEVEACDLFLSPAAKRVRAERMLLQRFKRENQARRREDAAVWGSKVRQGVVNPFFQPRKPAASAGTGANSAAAAAAMTRARQIPIDAPMAGGAVHVGVACQPNNAPCIVDATSLPPSGEAVSAQTESPDVALAGTWASELRGILQSPVSLAPPHIPIDGASPASPASQADDDMTFAARIATEHEDVPSTRVSYLLAIARRCADAAGSDAALWCDRFAPRLRDALLQDSSSAAQDSYAWLSAFGTARDEGSTALVVAGPSGVGKTCLVHALAHQLQYEVHEINAGCRRSGRAVLDMFREAAQSHQVSTDQSLALFDEADVVLPGDSGFAAAMMQLIRVSRRPIIITCQAVPECLLRAPAGTVKVVYASSPINELVVWLRILAHVAGRCDLPRASARLFALACAGDVRHCITALQAWTYHGRRSLRDPLLSALGAPYFGDVTDLLCCPRQGGGGDAGSRSALVAELAPYIAASHAASVGLSWQALHVLAQRFAGGSDAAAEQRQHEHAALSTAATLADHLSAGDLLRVEHPVLHDGPVSRRWLGRSDAAYFHTLSGRIADDLETRAMLHAFDDPVITAAPCKRRDGIMPLTDRNMQLHDSRVQRRLLQAFATPYLAPGATFLARRAIAIDALPFARRLCALDLVAPSESPCRSRTRSVTSSQASEVSRRLGLTPSQRNMLAQQCLCQPSGTAVSSSQA